MQSCRPWIRPFAPSPARRKFLRPRAPLKCSSESQATEVYTIPQRLNNVPASRETRKFFYDDVCSAVKTAVAAEERLLSVRLTIPETNPEMDVYRIGTVLELVRDLVTDLATDGKRVKVCVQQALGQGVFQGLPLSLSGVRRIMENMDWGDVFDFVSFGNVGSDHLDDSSYYVIVAPQNVVGSTIMTKLLEMADAAVEQRKTLILFNPLLKDLPSASGVMGVRGRKERMEFADSFVPAYHFRLLYSSSAMMYPIRGALRHVYGGPWEVFKRVDLGKRTEEYRFVGSFDREPDGSLLTPLFQEQPQKKNSGAWWNL
ncbi:probable adenylate kinase 5, chloroplastic [Coccomyxa sp. Obi]|nr:probable adenylate kinase 5, chloroplastic [Coccomyxa sp. Obi]